MRAFECGVVRSFKMQDVKRSDHPRSESEVEIVDPFMLPGTSEYTSREEFKADEPMNSTLRHRVNVNGKA